MRKQWAMRLSCDFRKVVLWCAPLLIAATAFAESGSPRLFTGYTGDYSGTATYKAQAGSSTSSGDLDSDATLSMKTSPTSAVLEISSTGTVAGTSVSPQWAYTFKRRNVCVIDIVYPNGNVGQIVGTYKGKRGRVTFSGTLQVRSGNVLYTGTASGKLRFGTGSLRVVETDTLSSNTVFIRQKLTK